MLERLAEIVKDPVELFWVLFGLAAQSLFAGRFIWQWFVSEKKKRSVVPPGFWILSLVGGLMLFVYACQRQDPVFIIGQGLGVIIYVRNLMLIWRSRTAIRRRHPRMIGGRTGAFPAHPAGPAPVHSTAAEQSTVP